MAAGFELIADHHPELWDGFAAYVDALWSSERLPAGTLELCRLRIAHLLGADAESELRLGPRPEDFELTVAELARWSSSPRYGPVQRASLAFAEQFLLDVQAVDATVTEPVARLVGPPGLVTLALGVGVAEALTRGAVLLDAPVPARPSTSLTARVAGGRP